MAKIEVKFNSNVVYEGKWYSIGQVYELTKEEYEELKRYCSPIQKTKAKDEGDKKAKQK